MIPAVEAAEALRDQLLSDDQVKSFIVRGFHLVRLDPADPDSCACVPGAGRRGGRR